MNNNYRSAAKFITTIQNDFEPIASQQGQSNLNKRKPCAATLLEGKAKCSAIFFDPSG
jgi:hypothetical protein